MSFSTIRLLEVSILVKGKIYVKEEMDTFVMGYL